MILFAYMYQVNIPMIYNELESKNRKRMSKVVWRGSMAGIFLYASVGVFGYLTFYNKPAELLKQNILLADYNSNAAVIIGQVTSFISVYVAMPLLYLPAKETVEELFFRGRRMKPRQNVLVTFGLVFVSYFFGILIPSIGDAMALAGCTTNPMVRTPKFSQCLDWVPNPCDNVLGNPQRKTCYVKGEATLRRRVRDYSADIDTRAYQLHRLENVLLNLVCLYNNSSL